MDAESQSQDSEPLPHPGDAGSYSNLFDMGQDMSLGDSAHSLRNRADSPQPYVHRTRNVAPPSTLHVPGRPVTAPMATPDSYSPNSPTGHNNMKGRSRGLPLANDAKYPTTQALIADSEGHVPVRAAPRSQHSSMDNVNGDGYISGQPLSAGAAYALHPVADGSNSNNGRDVVGLRHVMPRHKESGYSSATTVSAGGVRSQPHPAQDIHGVGIRNIPGAIMRPMSFVRAMEMSDSLAQQERKQHTRHVQRGMREDVLQEETDTSQVLYGSNYEISV